MHDHERDPTGPADAREDRDVRLAAALDDGDLRPVGIVAEGGEDRRQDELFRPALDEDRRAREEELAPLGVELAHDPEGLVGVERLRLDDVRASPGRVADEDELLQPRDVEEGGRVRRVDDLVAFGRQRAQPAVEVPLRVGTKEELGLLDQEGDAADAGFLARVDACDERRCARRVRSELGRVAEAGPEAFDRLAGVVGEPTQLEKGARPLGRPEKDDGRRPAATGARPLCRLGGEADAAAVGEPCLDGHGHLAARNVPAVGRRRGWVEQRLNGAEEVRLPRARLADEGSHRAERQLDVARRAIRAHSDGLEEGHRATLAADGV